MKIHELNESTMLLEKQMIFNKGAPYGQVVFMMGGAGSGKGFVISNFMQGEKFKQRNVDDFKTLLLKYNELSNKYPELKKLDLKNPDDVFKLHEFIEKKGIVDKTLDLLLGDLKKGRLPNLIFDRTGKLEEIMQETWQETQKATQVEQFSKIVDGSWHLINQALIAIARENYWQALFEIESIISSLRIV